MIRKADVVLFFILLATGLLISWTSLTAGTEGEKVLVTVSGQTYGIYDLREDRSVEIARDGHTNNIIIEDGHVSMAYSDCANQVCVDTGAIHLSGDSIVCLPNKVMIEITGGGKDGDVDVISG